MDITHFGVLSFRQTMQMQLLAPPNNAMLTFTILWNQSTVVV